MRQKTQNHFFKFSIHLSVRKFRENYRQIYGKSKASLWKNLSTGTPPKFFQDNPLLCSFSLQLILFFRTAVLWKLFDIRFSYKYCNFSHVCLLVKMASKTVTRSTDSRLEGFKVSSWFLKIMKLVEYRIAKKCHDFRLCCRRSHHHCSRGCRVRFYFNEAVFNPDNLILKVLLVIAC